MNARETILSRIQLARFDLSAHMDVPRAYQGAMGKGSTDLLEERLCSYKATVRKVARSAIPSAVAECLGERSIESVVVPESIPIEWLAMFQGVTFRDEPRLSYDALNRIDGVVTTCEVAIAETGTIVLTHGAKDGRRALTLLPDYHLVIVREEQVVSGLPDAILLLDPMKTMTWVSGPSATSDIELSRVEGVHGPRVLEVLLVFRELAQGQRSSDSND